MKIGEEQLAFYDGKNLGDHTITGHALYNVTPDVVGRYFHKTECFCFTSQTLAAGREGAVSRDLLGRPGDPERPGDTGHPHDHAVLHLLPLARGGGAERRALAKAGPHTGNTGQPRILETGSAGG